MSRLKYAMPVLFLVTTLAVAVVHGRATGRWTPLPPLDGYIAALATVPMHVGDWQGSDLPMDDVDAMKRGGIDGHISRRYYNENTGEVLSVLVVCGRPGPISVHTPDVCYRGAGFTPVGEPDRKEFQLGERKQTLWDLRLHPPASRAGDADLEIRWAWLAGKGLEAPANPRVTYSGEPALYKLYVIQERRLASASAKPGGSSASDPGLTFLTVFAPVLEDALRFDPAPAE